jgi:hypothetical protein
MLALLVLVRPGGAQTERLPSNGPRPAACPPVRIAQRAQRPPALLTADKPAAARFAQALRAEVARNAADPGSDSYTLTYCGHNLVSLLLTSEMRGASISLAFRRATFDGCTGDKLDMGQELDPRRQEAFQRAAQHRLSAQIEAFVEERGPQSDDPLLDAEDVAYLRRQAFELDPEQLLLQADAAFFPVEVRNYRSSLLGKIYAGRFGAAFSFAD